MWAKRLGRQAQALAVLEAALAGRLDHGAVVRRVGDDGDARMVLRGRPHHGRAADVDLLDALLEARARGDGLPERVEVDDDQVEGRDPEVRELADVGRLTPVGEDPGVDGRMQGLDSAVQAFGEAGQSGDLGDRDPGLGDGRGRRAGRYDAASGFVECSRQLFDARLVGDGYDGAAQGYTHGDSLKSPERHPGVRRPLCGAAPRWSVPSDTSRGPSSVQRRPPRGGSGSSPSPPCRPASAPIRPAAGPGPLRRRPRRPSGRRPTRPASTAAHAASEKAAGLRRRGFRPTADPRAPGTELSLRTGVIMRQDPRPGTEGAAVVGRGASVVQANASRTGRGG